MTPATTNEWKAIPATWIPVHRIVGSQPTTLLNTIIRMVDPWSEITEDDAIYVTACDCGAYDIVDGHHRVRAARWKRRPSIKARVYGDLEKVPLKSIQAIFAEDGYEEGPPRGAPPANVPLDEPLAENRRPNLRTDCHYCGESIAHLDHQGSCCSRCKHTIRRASREHNFVSGVDSRGTDFTACDECGAEE